MDTVARPCSCVEGFLVYTIIGGATQAPRSVLTDMQLPTRAAAGGGAAVPVLLLLRLLPLMVMIAKVDA